MKILIVILIIIGMIILLLGINHLTRNDDMTNSEDTILLKKDLKEDIHVITDKSVFHKFLARDRRKVQEK